MDPFMVAAADNDCQESKQVDNDCAVESGGLDSIYLGMLRDGPDLI
jgi:hypothetical protein